MATIQRDGEVDLVLRCMEAELARRDAAAHQNDMPFIGHYAAPMTVYWMGSMYEACRLLRDGELACLSRVAGA